MALTAVPAFLRSRWPGWWTKGHWLGPSVGGGRGIQNNEAKDSAGGRRELGLDTLGSGFSWIPMDIIGWVHQQ